MVNLIACKRNKTITPGTTDYSKASGGLTQILRPDEHIVGDDVIEEPFFWLRLLHFLLELWVKRNERSQIRFGDGRSWNCHVPELLGLTCLELGQATVRDIFVRNFFGNFWMRRGRLQILSLHRNNWDLSEEGSP